jgi:DNA-binding transcriptional MerR regulator/methylmalonyl-CoA mutase cobalamin-binding subunit
VIEPVYRIGELARLTGLSTHAIRVWERRYGTILPGRTAGGARLYTDADVQRLRLIKKLLAQGYAISNVIKLDTQELARLVPLEPRPLPSARSSEEQRARALVDEMLDALAEMDVPRATRSLAQAIRSFSPHELVLRVLAPALEQLGVRWQDGTLCIASEHAATAMLRTQLGALLAAQAVTGDAPVLCSTPAGELHELGALMVAVVMAMHGRRVLYLGANLPTSELIRAARLSRAWAVALSVVSLSPDVAGREIEELCRGLPRRVQVLVGGRRAPELLELPKRVQSLRSLSDLENWLLAAPP